MIELLDIRSRVVNLLQDTGFIRWTKTELNNYIHDSLLDLVRAIRLPVADTSVTIGSTAYLVPLPTGLMDINGGSIDNVSHIIGGHVLPKMNSDKIGLKQGSMAAIVELIELSIIGPGGHTSRPAETVDLIWAMSQLVLSMEQSVKRCINQQEPVVLAFGKVIGGNAVGMSTFPEFLKCQALNMECIVISCMTNYGAGLIKGSTINHTDVLRNAKKFKNDFLFNILS